MMITPAKLEDLWQEKLAAMSRENETVEEEEDDN
jgi:hypothetical protein